VNGFEGSVLLVLGCSELAGRCKALLCLGVSSEVALVEAKAAIMLLGTQRLVVAREVEVWR